MSLKELEGAFSRSYSTDGFTHRGGWDTDNHIIIDMMHDKSIHEVFNALDDVASIDSLLNYVMDDVASTGIL
jgi:hypothetical protein